MSNINNLQTNACTPAATPNCQSCHEVGWCNDCYYYSTYQSYDWCDKTNHRIEDANREKGCYTPC